MAIILKRLSIFYYNALFLKTVSAFSLRERYFSLAIGKNWGEISFCPGEMAKNGGRCV